MTWAFIAIVALVAWCCQPPPAPQKLTPEQVRAEWQRELQRAMDSVKADTCQPMPQCVDPVPGRPK